MVSNAREDLPEPLKPVTTTSLSRGIWSVRFLRLCSRAPPILMNSLLTDPVFRNQTIEKSNRDFARSKEEPEKWVDFLMPDGLGAENAALTEPGKLTVVFFP